MEAIFQRIIGNDFADLAGLRAQASIPLSEQLVNEILAATLPGDGTIRSFYASIHADNRVSVDLKTNLLPWRLHLRLKLDRSVDYASFDSPKLRMWLENNRLVGRLGSLFHALPEWARLYGNQLVVDLGVFAQTPRQRKLLELVKSVEVATEEGQVILILGIQVD